jgi:hypothetical protein
MLWIDLSRFLAILSGIDWRVTLNRHLRSHEATKQYHLHFSSVMQSANSVFVVRRRIEEWSLGKTTSSLQREFGLMTSSERIYSIFFKTVNLLRSQRFSDRRDAIYGYLGLLSAVLPPGMSSPIRPDYNLSDVDVLTNEVWHMVGNMPYLDVLSGVQNKVVGGGDLPSWVPDLSSRFIGAHLQQIRRSYARPQFDASMTKSPCSSFRFTEGRGLTLVGIRVADITGSGLWLFEGNIKGTRMETLLEVLLGQQRNYLPIEEPLDKALCRTLLADTFPDIRDEVDDREAYYRTLFREWWTSVLVGRMEFLRGKVEGDDGHIINLLLELGSDWDWIPSLDEVLDATDQPGELPSSPLQFVMHRLWLWRSFFHTGAGHFGLGPRNLEAMDEVWLLKGGRTPFVLRKRAGGNDYHFVGEVYVHGLMYGEASTSALSQEMGPVTIF